MATHKDFRKAWILLLLREGSSYGYELRRKLRERALKLDPAMMYRTLRDMERAGLISSRWTRSKTGPRRHVYEVTDEGRDELARIAGSIQAARDAQSDFLVAYEESGAGQV